MHLSFHSTALRRAAALLGACLFVLCAAGCHRHNYISGYGVGWVTLTDEPGDFAAYVVTVDSVTLTGQVNGVITAVSTPELVDFTKLRDISELWSAASIPVDTYTQATITLDYTSAALSLMVNGAPQLTTIIDPTTSAAATTISVTVNLDPANLLKFTPTYATTNAQRLALDFDLAASNVIDMTTTPATVRVRPFFSVSTSAMDNKLIRVRGPLVNSNGNYTTSNGNVGTYSIYLRPFADEANTAGTLSLFNSANTIYQLNGTGYQGVAGINALSASSTGTTMTAAYTTFTPTATPNAIAGVFTPVYVIAGSTLEDYYTEGLEGEVIARSGNTLTLRNATLYDTPAETQQYKTPDAQVILGPNTIVTVDGTIGLTGLNANSVAVGDHITARGLYSLPASGVVTLDATGSTTNTGSVRIQSTSLFGSFVSDSTGSLVMNLQSIDGFPVSAYNFAGTGTSTTSDAIASAYVVNTGSITLPADATTANAPIFVQGYAAPFGSAPPDFIALQVPAEAAVPATLIVNWSGTGTTAPFVANSATAAGFTIDLSNAAYQSGVLRIGDESIDLKTLPASPTVVPLPASVPTATGLPPVFMPAFSVGSTVSGISTFNTLTAFETLLNTDLTAATPTPALQLDAHGTYDRATNTFSAATVNVVL